LGARTGAWSERNSGLLNALAGREQDAAERVVDRADRPEQAELLLVAVQKRPVLLPGEPVEGRTAELLKVSADVVFDRLKTKVIEVIEAEPGNLDIEDAEVVIAGGRGVGKGEAFEILHRLAELLGGSVAGTRPVIDWQTLPFERQIGQTGKTVAPRLIFNCGISGANEYTAGIEKSQLSIAINTDPRARIFRFADLGVVGDVQEILPFLISRLQAAKRNGEREV